MIDRDTPNQPRPADHLRWRKWPPQSTNAPTRPPTRSSIIKEGQEGKAHGLADTAMSNRTTQGVGSTALEVAPASGHRLTAVSRHHNWNHAEAQHAANLLPRAAALDLPSPKQRKGKPTPWLLQKKQTRKLKHRWRSQLRSPQHYQSFTATTPTSIYSTTPSGPPTPPSRGRRPDITLLTLESRRCCTTRPLTTQGAHGKLLTYQSSFWAKKIHQALQHTQLLPTG
jgi:hypothetical protein